MSKRTVESLVKELIELVRTETRLEILTSLGGSAGAAGGASVAKGQKRAPEAIDKLTAELLAHIKKNPGQRIEVIAKGMGVLTKDLNLPVKRLLETRKVRAKGQKRATTYTAK
jgi:hypothetical protein